MTATCPECDQAIEVDQAQRLSEIVNCPECLGELEVISLDPPTLALAPEPEEDWGE
jgi:alpha-aminoadipate/glutamate carrier protein LysW